MTSLICDDHPLVRSALAMLVEQVAGSPVLEAADFAEAWALSEEHGGFALCVVDLHMPGMTPREGLAGLKTRAPAAKIVVVTGSDSDDDLLDALDLGVEGFVPKAAQPAVIEAALRLVLAGGRYRPERVTELARTGATASRQADAQAVNTTTAGLAPSPSPSPSVQVAYGRLSSRQRDVLTHLALGRSNKEIARLLVLSPATVKTHVAHIISALGASNRTEAAALARDQALI